MFQGCISYNFYLLLLNLAMYEIMKKQLFYIFILIVVVGSCTQKSSENTFEYAEEDQGIVFDSVQAAKTGADDYGMKQYVMAFLKRGPNRDRTKEESEKLQRAHLDNIGRLAEEGKLVLAGPFISEGDLRGIYIFDVKTEEEARVLVETDPAIKAGSLTMELIPWYGSAALMEVGEIHKRIAKIEI